MEATFWQKQSKTAPLFPDLWWSRPENRALAGKLLIIGGHSHGFSLPATAYGESVRAGVGLTRVVLPLAVKRIAGKLLETVEYAPSTPSGSFGREALASWLESAAWADGVLFAGELGRNSETAIVMEQFLKGSSLPVVLTKDAVDYTYTLATLVAHRRKTTLVLSLSQLQKLASALHYPEAFTLGMDLIRTVDTLHDFSTRYRLNIITNHHGTVCVANGGQISTTPTDDTTDLWQAKTAVHAAVWLIQNPTKPFEALTTAVHATHHM